MRKISKYIEYFLTKLRVLVHQQYYKKNDVTLKYMFDEVVDSNEIVVVFSSCTRKGIKARYNYVRTLKQINVNKLYILDDFSGDKRGAYYLGKNMNFSIEKAVIGLLNEKFNAVNYSKKFFVGSSKGGYAAIRFGLEFKDSIIIAGSPQYFLGDYFIDERNDYDELVKFVTGETISTISNIDVVQLNNHLKNIIMNLKYTEKIRVYIHYSVKEHTYLEHIKDLICDLEKQGVTVIKDEKEYINHSDVSLYFPDFLIKSIGEKLNINKSDESSSERN